MPEYQKGTGRDQLPQGGASQANASTPPPAEGPQTSPVDIPVQYVQGALPDPSRPDKTDTENSVLLTDPADSRWTAPTGLRGTNRVPAAVIRALPTLGVISKDPRSTPALRAMYRALVHQTEKEQGTRA